VYEPAAGIKASLINTLQYFSESMFAVQPAERGRVYFLLAWLHAVILERLRYAPLGWSKKYEFGESDLRTASDTIGSWITALAQGR
jgi:dynein heavy chain 1